jgi:hypothetical protein
MTTWTNNEPTEPGWYWYSKDHPTEENSEYFTVVELVKRRDCLAISPLPTKPSLIDDDGFVSGGDEIAPDEFIVLPNGEDRVYTIEDMSGGYWYKIPYPTCIKK